MTTKKSLQSRSREALTKTEKRVFNMITKDFLNATQIRIKMNCSRQNVSKHLRRIVEKGYLNSGNQPTKFVNQKSISTCQPKSIPSLDSEEKIRLHGDEWHIEIIQKSVKYLNLIKKCNTFQLSGHTIRLFEDSMEVYAGDGISFWGVDEDDADRKALDYWYGFFSRLENYTKTILVKNGSQNIRRVNWHFAEIGSEMCEDYLENEGKKIKVYCPLDGKLAFTTDESWGDKEQECIHPKSAKRDSKNVGKQINDWRLNNPRTNSEIDKDIGDAKKVLLESAKQIKQNAENQGIYGDNSVTHVALMRRIKTSINNLDAREERRDKRDELLLKAIQKLANK